MRVRFCWLCSRQLWGRHFTKMLYDGHDRIFHKTCAKNLRDPHYDPLTDEEVIRADEGDTE